MKLIKQTLRDILDSLSVLNASWEDDVSRAALDTISKIPVKETYTKTDLAELLDADFKTGILIFRLFLELSKDQLETELADYLGAAGIGVKSYRRNQENFLSGLEQLGLLEAMSATVNRKVTWTDLLAERLKSGRGKAIRGQNRGRDLEDFAENVIEEVFGTNYESRCQFVGADDESAKCDFAVPSRTEPRILVEAKGYGATGSKMTDVIGDLNSIIRHKRNDAALIFITDGITWKRRTSDLQKIIEMQNRGEITRIFTTSMVKQFKNDLKILKDFYGI
ncbi:MAG: DpnII family type II restriction endonuclease [Acidobacteriota bacterium]|nr:DpnII family type II restriction endonuclease [Acidobacteriota bacterium]